MFKHKTNKIIISLMILLGLSFLGLSNVISGEVFQEQTKDAIAKAVEWLKTNQNPDNSWGDEEISMIATASALEALHNSGEVESKEYKRGIDWMTLSFPESSEYVAKKVFSLTKAEIDITLLPEYLASQINERDDGFGFQKYFTSDPITTAMVLRALSESEYNDPGTDPNYTLKSILSYLFDARDPGSGWPLNYSDKSNIFATLIILEALRPHYDTMDENFKITVSQALTWISNKQTPDGKFENTVYTSFAYKVLKSYDIVPNYYEQGINYLLNFQNPDGSFGDIYTTATVILGLIDSR